ncbi:ABC transporter ATP-binding protein [Sesbania bispinosa]|nr:ABC transporter ATP-binding protein [Sesbania bispinosa]
MTYRRPSFLVKIAIEVGDVGVVRSCCRSLQTARGTQEEISGGVHFGIYRAAAIFPMGCCRNAEIKVLCSMAMRLMI